MTHRELRIGILGAGIMGCSLALFLARKGARVTLVDRAAAPFEGASRWNEGKVHLGYLYAGDPTLATAHKVLEGGLAFRCLVEELVGGSIASAVTPSDDVFLTHRDSIVDADATSRYFDAISDLVRGHPNARRYLADLRAARAAPLTPVELGDVTGSPKILAGFRVPERSVNTNWLADRFVGAIAAERAVEFVPATRIDGIAAIDGAWRLACDPPLRQRFDVIVNALWEGRAAIDATVGLLPDGPRSYRYRLALFVNVPDPCTRPSVTIATGPFGDCKNYNGHDLYLSWYPAGLILDAGCDDRRALPDLNAGFRRRIATDILAGLEEYVPELIGHVRSAGEPTVAGGWVVAQGGGSIGDPASSLHRRDRFGVTRIGSYVSVDTGKYSTAPWMAARLADELVP